MTALQTIAVGVLILILLPIITIDVREHRIPNSLNALLAAAGLVFQFAATRSWSAVLLGLGAACAVIITFLGLIGLMKLLRRPGTLGLGDVKFLAAASIWVGFVGSTLVFVIAAMLALGYTLASMPWRKVDMRGAIPFSPFLAAGLAFIFAATAVTAPAGRSGPTGLTTSQAS
jgi:leader peptidase (prepilin peptidase)/N-methyltransferase